MKSFYTIIKVAPNPASGDTLSIGLLLKGEDKFWVKFSSERISIVKRLLENKTELLDFSIKQIIQKIEHANSNLDAKKTYLFIDDLFPISKASHLNQYSNGIIRFSEPNVITSEITEASISKLFNVFVQKDDKPDEVNFVQKRIQQFESKIQTKLISKVLDKVHTNFELTPQRLPGLYFNLNIDCIGKNGIITAAKAISFDRSFQTIDKEISHYFCAMSVLDSKYPNANRKHSKYFIIGDEPIGNDKKKEHQTWEQLRENSLITMIASDESEIVAKEILESGAVSFIDSDAN